MPGDLRLALSSGRLFDGAYRCRACALNAEPGQESLPVFLGFMSLPFLSAGGLLLFERRWLTLDLSRGCLIRQ